MYNLRYGNDGRYVGQILFLICDIVLSSCLEVVLKNAVILFKVVSLRGKDIGIVYELVVYF